MNHDQLANATRLPITPTLRVVKVGGSLIDAPGGIERSIAWMEASATQFAATIVLTGGGQQADAVRQLEKRYGLAPDAAHALAIRAMSLYTWVLNQHAKWPAFWELSYLNDWTRRLLQRTSPERSTSIATFDVARFLHRIEAELPGRSLPVGWHVTSDSIAARLATVLQYERPVELVLLKSCLPEDPRCCHQQATATGYVDAHFLNAAAALSKVRCVDVSTADFPSQRLRVSTTTTNDLAETTIPRESLGADGSPANLLRTATDRFAHRPKP